MYELEKATSLAKSGKPGPVWLDIPLDVQASQVELSQLRHYEETQPTYECKDEDVLHTIELLNKAERPMVLVGNGIRLAKAIPEMNDLIEEMQIPVMILVFLILIILI